MRAVQVVEYGKPVEVRRIAAPEPAKGEVRLKVLAAGVNFADLLHVQGSYQEKPPLPFTLGMEVCGVVEALGPGVSVPAVGQRVAAYLGHGGMAEQCCLAAENCVPVPGSMRDETAAGFLITYGTSHVALERRARLQPGERLLVLGAGGGVGLTAVEIGKLMGAEVIAAARGETKLAAASEAGADHLINTAADDVRETVRKLGGADVIYDPVGGDLFKQAMRAANPEARLIPIGFASGSVPQIPANILLVKNLTAVGVYWGGYRAFNASVLTDSISTLMSWFSKGRLRPFDGCVLDLGQASDALELLRSRKAVGKIVIRI